MKKSLWAVAHVIFKSVSDQLVDMNIASILEF